MVWSTVPQFLFSAFLFWLLVSVSSLEPAEKVNWEKASSLLEWWPQQCKSEYCHWEVPSFSLACTGWDQENIQLRPNPAKWNSAQSEAKRNPWTSQHPTRWTSASVQRRMELSSGILSGYIILNCWGSPNLVFMHLWQSLEIVASLAPLQRSIHVVTRINFRI